MKKYNLLVVAHPDDETIFGAGLLQVYRRRPWKVICVTDGNADGQGELRKQDFIAACHEFKIKNCEMWDFPDRYESRLDLASLEPTWGVTYGVGAFLQCKKVLILARGERKKSIMKKAATDKNLPIGWIMEHHDVTLISDFDF